MVSALDYSHLDRIANVIATAVATHLRLVQLDEVWKTKGKKLSAAHKAKISAALKGKKTGRAWGNALNGGVGKASAAIQGKVGEKVLTPDGKVVTIGKMQGKAWASVEGGSKKWYKTSELVPHSDAPPKPMAKAFAAGTGKSTMALKAAHPVGSLIQTPHGPLKVTGHTTGYISVEGGPKKWLKVDELAASSSTLTPGGPSLVGTALPKAATPHGFPDKVGDVKVVQSLGGSTGAKLVQDADGNKFVLKAGANPEHLKAEFHADRVYEAAGVAVPKGHLYEGATPRKMTEYLADAKPLSALSGTELQAAHDQLKKNFVLDAVMGNRDVVGMANDNIMVKNGQVFRIDNGGSFDFRAQGLKKEFGPKVSELDSMLNPAVNPQTAKAFHGLTAAEMHSQALALHASKAAILKATPDQYKAAMSARIDDALAQTTMKVQAEQLKKAGAGTPIPSHIPPVETKVPTGVKDKGGAEIHVGDTLATGYGIHMKVDSYDPKTDKFNFTITKTDPTIVNDWKLGQQVALSSNSMSTKSIIPDEAGAPASSGKAYDPSIGKKKAALAAAHPVGSDLVTPNGSFKVTGHTTGYVSVEGAPKKWYKVDELAPASSSTPTNMKFDPKDWGPTGTGASAPAGPVKSAVQLAHEKVPPAPGIKSAYDSVKYDAKNPPTPGQAVYVQSMGKNAVVMSVTPAGASTKLKFEDGSEQSVTTSILKAYDPVKAAKPSVSFSGSDVKSTSHGAGSLVHDSTWTSHWASGWVPTLTPGQKTSLSHYTGSGYAHLNKTLRDGDMSKLSDANLKHVKNIDAGLAKGKTPKDITVWRGVHWSDFDPKKAEGALITDKGYMSTSVASSSSFGGNVKYEISIPKGTSGAYVKPVSKNSNENEFLIPRGGQLRVIEVIQSGSSWHVKTVLEGFTDAGQGAVIGTFEKAAV